MPTYLIPGLYAKLVAALLNSSYDPPDKENAIKIALGELADLWPEKIATEILVGAGNT